MVVVVEETQDMIKFSIDRSKIYDEFDKIHKIAEKKFKHYDMFWDGDVLVVKEAALKRCSICGKFDVLKFEHEDGEHVYKICALCFLRLNS